jgi:hypothetical protein
MPTFFAILATNQPVLSKPFRIFNASQYNKQTGLPINTQNQEFCHDGMMFPKLYFQVVCNTQNYSIISHLRAWINDLQAKLYAELLSDFTSYIPNFCEINSELLNIIKIIH